jgi:hypothetical protein
MTGQGLSDHICARCGAPFQVAVYPGEDADTRCGPCVTGDYVDFVFNGPPDQRPAEFVDVEDRNRRSVRYGEWLERDDGVWVLRVPRRDPPAL